MDSYTTISTIGRGTYSEKRSKFLAFAHPVETVEEAMNIVATYRKKYYDARHVCYAYVLSPTRETFRANDDGEPSSTAGKPILGQLNTRGLTNVLVVVVRYYGGINLGTGGLIVAYRTAASLALDDATIIEREVEEIITYNFTYASMNSVMRVVKELSPRVVEQHFDLNCSITLAIVPSKAELLRKKLQEIAFK